MYKQTVRFTGTLIGVFITLTVILSTFDFTPVAAQGPNDLVLTQDLFVSSANVQVNEYVLASYRVKNIGGAAITLDFLGVQGRLNGDLNGTPADFHWIENLTLQPGEEYYYETGRTFDTVGNWRLRPNYKPLDGDWSDVHRADGTINEAWITVIDQAPFTSCADVTEIPTDECNALVAFYHSTDGPNWTNNDGWLTTNTPCGWNGVTCDTGHITILSLFGNKLSGSIPPELGDLTNLTHLFLGFELEGGGGGNQLRGDIPPELGNLTNLQGLYISNNQLSGSIPSALGNLTNLQSLDLSYNHLNGNIPSALGNLTNLNSLLLHTNQLSGGIPSSLGNLTNLYSLTLDENLLSGNIPSNLGNLTHLQYINLGDNQLTGNIPSSFGNLNNLQVLRLWNNQLSGNIPSELGNLINLQNLEIDSNPLSGNVPLALGDLTNLQTLELHHTQLSGALPGALTKLSLLERFIFYDTNLCIPPGSAFQDWLSNIAYVDPGPGEWEICDIYSPATDGYQFENWVSSSTWAVFRDVFGPVYVPTSSYEQADPILQELYRKSFLAAQQVGECLGMTATSVLLYNDVDWLEPNDFLEQQGATDVININPPNTGIGGMWLPGEVSNFIVKYHSYQLGQQTNNYLDNYDLTVTETLNMVTASIDAGLTDPLLLILYQQTPDRWIAHAVMPYTYVRNGDVVAISVYDPNHPGSTAQLLDGNLSTEMWSYHNDIGLWGTGFCIDCAKLKVLPLSLFQHKPIPVWASGGDDIHIATVEQAHLTIIDDQGRRLGYLDNSNYVDEIPDASQFIPIGIAASAGDIPEIYHIDDGTSFETAVVYTQTGTVTVTDILPGSLVRVTGSGSPGVTDTIHLSSDLQAVTVTAGSTAAGRAVNIINLGTDVGVAVTVSDFSLDQNGTATLSIGDPRSRQVITMTSSSASTGYSVAITPVSSDGGGNFVTSNIALTPGDTHVINLDWADTATATLQIDHGSDGSFDEIAVVENEASGNVYLPLILKNCN